MNLVLEDADVREALKWYAEQKLGVTFANKEAGTLVTVDGAPVNNIQVTFREVVPRMVEAKVPLSVQNETPRTQEVVLPRKQGSLEEALDLFNAETVSPPPTPITPMRSVARPPKKKRDWSTEGVVSTNLADLGKEDPSDFDDEIGPQ